MKNIMSIFALISLFVVTGAFAEQKPAEKCTVATMKLEDARKLIHADTNHYVSDKLAILASVYADYIKECREEAEKNAKEAMLVEAVGNNKKPTFH